MASQGFTTVKYGDVALYRCITRNISQTPVFDESGTNLMYQRTVVSVTGHMNGRDGYVLGLGNINNISYSLSTDGTGLDANGLASNRERQFRRQLPPRLPFVMLVGDTNGDGTGGDVLIQAIPAGEMILPDPFVPRAAFRNDMISAAARQYGDISLSLVDLNNGPRCTEFVVTAVTGNELFTVDATFEICLIECAQDGSVPNNLYGILSNRWSFVDSYDANMRTVRTYSGNLKLASANLNAQMLRSLVIPPLVRMFRRDHIEIAVSEDGLTLNYSITDIEAAQSPPYPARTWSVTHTISGNNAMVGDGYIDVDLSGDSNVNKADLIELAIYIITAKLYGCTPAELLVNTQQKPASFWSQYILKHIEFTDTIGDENRIHARATVTSALKEGNNITVFTQASNFGVPLGNSDVKIQGLYDFHGRPDYDRTKSFGGYAGDNIEYTSPAVSVAQVFLNYMQTPCDHGHPTNLSLFTPGFFNLQKNPTGGLYYDYNTPVKNNIPDDYDRPGRYTINISPDVSAPQIDNPYQSPGHKTSMYTHWHLENLYVVNKMRVQMPVATRALPDGYQNLYQSSVFVQLSSGQAKRVIRVAAERVGQEPQFPDPDNLPEWIAPQVSYSNIPSGYPFPEFNGQIKQICLKRKVRPRNPIVLATGQLLFRADAEYIIGLTREPYAGERLELGNDMWRNTGQLRSQATGALTASNWYYPGTGFDNTETAPKNA